MVLPLSIFSVRFVPHDSDRFQQIDRAVGQVCRRLQQCRGNEEAELQFLVGLVSLTSHKGLIS